MRMVTTAVLLATLLVVGACGSDGDGDPAPVDTTTGEDAALLDVTEPPEDATDTPGVALLNEVVFDDPADGPDWVELYNPGPGVADLSGWGLSDLTNGPKFTFPDGVKVAPGAFLVVKGAGTAPEIFFEFGLSGDEMIVLYRPDRTEADRLDWTAGQVPKGASFGRYPDGEGDPIVLYPPTPGDENAAGAVPQDIQQPPTDVVEPPADAETPSDVPDPTDAAAADTLDVSSDVPVAASRVVINEVMVRAIADDGTEFPDWVELVVVGSEPVDIGGWTLTDDIAQPTRYRFPTGTEIAPGEFFVIEGKGSSSSTFFDFGFSSAELAQLSDADGNVVDLADWANGDAPDGSSWGRRPDGTGTFVTLTPPSRGVSNE